MVGVGKKTTAVEVEGSSSKDAGFGTARARCRREEDPACGKKAEDGGIPLPAMPAATTAGDPAIPWPRDPMQALGGITAGSCYEPYVRHPMDDFDDLVKAFDEFIDGRKDETGIVDRGQPDKNDKINKRDATAVDPYARQPAPRATLDDDGGRLPRLYSRSSRSSVDPSRSHKRQRTHVKRHRPSHAQPTKEFSPISRQPPPLEQERIIQGLQYCDPIELMLRSKVDRRPNLEGLVVRPELAIQPSQNDLDEAAAAIDHGYSKAVAGVFRLTHTGTGFVHYGYTWDIAGAKADQFRRLRMACSNDTNCNNNSAPHPHRGLSTIVRRQQEQSRCVERPGSEGTRATSFHAPSDDEMLQLRFEVVREVPLPTRFRVSDFEETLRYACEEELLDRRAHLLMLAARRYKRNHVGSAFARMLIACRSDGDDEKCAAAAEVQRVWRGFHVRDSARRTRETEYRDRVAIEGARVRAILAAWGQTRHRGNMGRRRACGVRDEREEAATRRKQALVSAAVTIQEWVRFLYKRRKKAEAAADKAAVDSLLQAIRLEQETKGLPPKGATLRGSMRPINTTDAIQAPLERSSDWSAATPTGNTGDTIAPGNSSGRKSRRRPSSSRERRTRSITRSRGDNNDDPQEIQHPRSLRRPASAPRPNQMAGTSRPARDSVSVPTSTRFVPAVITDASRLVLEGDHHFTAATAIQATWRGFMARLGIRKHRRAAAALSRKREGKWRQQRGVVGKRVSVAWDERRGLEKAGSHGNGREGAVSCIEIQVAVRRRGWGGRACATVGYALDTTHAKDTTTSNKGYIR